VLWQMKAMPLFKTRKYEKAMALLDKAVFYDSAFLDYRAFMKCIFSKQYKEALEDFSICRKRTGNGYVMDHSYDVYSALCYLQLNEFEKARSLLEAQVAHDELHDRTHHFRLFYLGIACYELGLYQKAIDAFDRALKKFPQFSDAQFYKGKALGQLGRMEEGLAIIRAGKLNWEKGYSINEDNAIYELYPYQVAWRWRSVK
jgi:tetratricopeptide (TPR) repeat protein